MIDEDHNDESRIQRFVAATHAAWSAGKLDIVRDNYRNEAGSSSLEAFARGHDQYASTLRAAATLAPFAEDEYLVALSPDEFVLTSRALYILRAPPRVVALESIDETGTSGNFKMRIFFVKLRSGETIEYEGMTRVPDARVITTVRDGREPEDDVYWEARFRQVTTRAEKSALIENVTNPDTRFRLSTELARYVEPNSPQANFELAGLLWGGLVGVVVGVAAQYIASLLIADDAPLPSHLSAAIGAAAFCLTYGAVLVASRNACRAYLPASSLNIATGVVSAFPVLWIYPLVQWAFSVADLTTPLATGRSAVEDMQLLVNSGFGLFFTLLLWLVLLLITAAVWFGYAFLLTHLSNGLARRQMRRDYVLDHGIDRIGLMMLIAAQVLMLAWLAT